VFDGDSFTLIKTKLKRPRANGDLLARPHLINSLNEGLNRKLTLISAPAGFGKTTLAVQWLSQLPADRPSSESVSLSAWLSLDQDDNDLVVFLAYFIAAVQTAYSEACAGVQEMLKAPQLPIPRLRVQGNLLEMRTMQLRFTLDEAQSYLRLVLGASDALDAAAQAAKDE
jgi:LuxR family maltose regulon positive regulatory protein